jgi:hypothetical protein
MKNLEEKDKPILKELLAKRLKEYLEKNPEEIMEKECFKFLVDEI